MSRFFLRSSIVTETSFPREISHQQTCNLHRELSQKFVGF
ncbi:hypothetical protein K08M4_10910 [Vibrio syngnathi]|uniref:Uncharacterized protein n=1 Tax=Vibrio syngnathi TaxID=3034029 RepID=A0AA34TMY4_9VIBR|nr:hypothetical protein K08M4_10910 [Vibrio syngnathi]